MRKEPFGVGSIVHVLKRGARGMPITKNLGDQHRFMRMLYYLNDEYVNDDWEREVMRLTDFERPKSWPIRHELIHIYAWVLMPNHFHLILQEIQEKGVTRFMQKFCGSMTMHFNLKYEEKGSIFQGPYKSRTVGTDRYLMYLAPYVMVRNVFELYPGGLTKAASEFDTAWKWAVEQYAFSSLPEFAGTRGLPIVHPDAHELFDSRKHFLQLARDMILGSVGQNIYDLSFEEQ